LAWQGKAREYADEYLQPHEVEAVLKKGLSIPHTVVMDFVVEREEGVYPMVPAGAPITEMLLV